MELRSRFGNSIIFSEDGSRALLEDTNCTGTADRLLWDSQPPKQCAFTLTVSEVRGTD
jgi:hypothetical protein